MERFRAAAALTVETVAKPDGGGRRLTRLHPVLARDYAALVAVSTPAIERTLRDEVLANRAVGRGRWRTTALEPWRHARATWHRDIEAASADGATRAALVSDVADCYGALEPAVVIGRLRAAGGVPSTLGPLERCLRAMAERGTPGLPVGPAPSALLANVALAGVDERLRAAGLRHLRWVDDLVIFCEGRRDTARAFDALRRGLDDLGLRPNLPKTAVLHDRGAIGTRLLHGAGISSWDDATP
jgi:Reverse transcriptase (RNA-dependent DNA polymerase)